MPDNLMSAIRHINSLYPAYSKHLTWDEWIAGIIALFYAELSGFNSPANFPNQVDSSFTNAYKKIALIFPDEESLRAKEFIRRAIDGNGQKDDYLLAWAYQHLKKDKSRKVFYDVLKKGRKLQGQSLWLNTQFFTDDYMVRFLVKETLKRARLKQCSIHDVRIVDPACGAGNFLLTAFDFLMSNNYGKGNKAQLAKTLLSKVLVGYDIDPMMAGITKLTLLHRANLYLTAKEIKDIKLQIFAGESENTFGLFDDLKSEKKSELDRAIEGAKVRVFITNPPFAGKRDLAPSKREYLVKNYPFSNGDLCVAFMIKIMQGLSSGDIAGFVNQRACMYLSSFENFRGWLINNYQILKCVDLGTAAFKHISGEKTSVCLSVFENKSTSKKSVFYRLCDDNYEEKKAVLENARQLKSKAYLINQNDFSANKHQAFYYHISNSVRTIKREMQKYCEFATPMQGTSTGNHKKFVKLAWQAPKTKDWILVSKGGGFSKWVGLNYYKVLWGNEGEYIKKYPGSAIRNLKYMKETELVFSDTGTQGLSVRVLKPNQVFIASGPGIRILKGNKYAHLAFLNSRIATFFLRILNPKLTIAAGYIGRLPLPNKLLDEKPLQCLGVRCFQLKEAQLSRSVINLEYIFRPTKVVSTLEQLALKRFVADLSDQSERIMAEYEIELFLRKAYKLSRKDINSINLETGMCGAEYQENSKVGFRDIDDKCASLLNANCELKSGVLRSSNIGRDSWLEELTHYYQINVNQLTGYLKINYRDLANTIKKYIEDALHQITLNLIGFKNINDFNDFEKDIYFLSKQANIIIGDLDRSIYKWLKVESYQDWLVTQFPKLHSAVFWGQPIYSLNNQKTKILVLNQGNPNEEFISENHDAFAGAAY